MSSVMSQFKYAGKGGKSVTGTGGIGGIGGVRVGGVLGCFGAGRTISMNWTCLTRMSCVSGSFIPSNIASRSQILFNCPMHVELGRRPSLLIDALLRSLAFLALLPPFPAWPEAFPASRTFSFVEVSLSCFDRSQASQSYGIWVEAI